MANDRETECHDLVARVLNRQESLNAMEALDAALDPASSAIESEEYASTVLAFDTNVFLKLTNHTKSADIIDFLRTSFSGHALLPGQVIQEFWNNLSAIETLAASIKKHAENLKKEVEKVDPGYGDFAVRLRELMEEFQLSYGYLYDESLLRKLKVVVNLLSEKAYVPYCSRNDLSRTAATRKRTKTPPGFKDELDGDFFVWADLLLGVATLSRQGSSVTNVAFVTNDAKPDWTRNGIPHPILSAELKAVCGARLQIWSLEKLATIVSQ